MIKNSDFICFLHRNLFFYFSSIYKRNIRLNRT